MCMAIGPVSSVNFSSNYNNISFEGRRNKKHAEYQRHSTSLIKAVPLAALIAMSPMVDISDAFAIEPNIPKTEAVSGIHSIQQNEFVPLPASCKVLKDVHIEHPGGGYMGFKLINTDGNTSNYEMVEFTNVGATGRILDRGILKAVSITPTDSGRDNVRLNGINLSKTELDNYAPQIGIMRVLYTDTPDLGNILRGLINHPDNNDAVDEILLKNDYRAPHRFPTDLKIYKRILGIN